MAARSCRLPSGDRPPAPGAARLPARADPDTGGQPASCGLPRIRPFASVPFRSRLGGRGVWNAHAADATRSKTHNGRERGAVHVRHAPVPNGTTNTMPATCEVRSAGGQEGHAAPTIATSSLAWIFARCLAVGIRQAAATFLDRAAGTVAATDVASNAVDDEVAAEPVEARGASTGIGVTIETVGVLGAWRRSQNLLSGGITPRLMTPGDKGTNCCKSQRSAPVRPRCPGPRDAIELSFVHSGNPSRVSRSAIDNGSGIGSFPARAVSSRSGARVRNPRAPQDP